MKAIWNNTVIAESDDTVLVEGATTTFPRAPSSASTLPSATLGMLCLTPVVRGRVAFGNAVKVA
jgi:hypothetical protein